MSDFRASANAGWLSWGMNTFVKKPVGFTFRQMGNLVGWSTPANTTGDYIVTDILKVSLRKVCFFSNNRCASKYCPLIENKRTVTYYLLTLSFVESRISAYLPPVIVC